MTRVKTQKNRSSADRLNSILEGVDVWCSFYRANIHRFVKDYLGINLRLFQQIILFMMNISTNVIYTASRGQGKTFLTAIFSVARCILYPGTKIVVTSGSRGQAVEIIENIVNILMPQSENLRREIREYSTNISSAYVTFHNGSFIKVVTSNENARHNRANIIIVDEYRMVNKSILDTVIKKFLTSEREPNFYKKPEYKNYPKERNKQIYCSSAWLKSHWSWQLFQDYCVNMVDDSKSYFVCGIPYQLAVAEGLLNREQIEDEMSESTFDAIKYSMEMGCLFYGENERAFFNYENLINIRCVKQAIYPRDIYRLIGDGPVKYPQRTAGEIRILTADIAVMGSKKHRNDTTAIFVLQLIPTKDGQYIRNVVYSTSAEGGSSKEQALTIRKLYEEMDCDYIAIDTIGVGIGVYDNLVDDLVDEHTGMMYEALSCINDSEMAARYRGKSRTPRKVIYSIKANAGFNSNCAFLLRDSISRGKLRLLITEQELKSELGQSKTYKQLSAEQKFELELPYIQTTLLINELVNLEYTTNGKEVKIYEQYDKRKDRYSSLSYGNYIANTLEKRPRNRISEPDVMNNFSFDMRSPKVKGR